MTSDASPMAHELRLAEMARALHWLPDVYLEVGHYRRTSYRLFTCLPDDFMRKNDTTAVRIEKLRRRAFDQPNVLGEVA